MNTCPASGPCAALFLGTSEQRRRSIRVVPRELLSPLCGREFFYGPRCGPRGRHVVWVRRVESDTSQARREFTMESTEQVAPTQLLYHTDSYLSTFNAEVQAVDGQAIALASTAFFPGGGGQMADRGVLVWHGQRLPLASIEKRGDVVWHRLAGAEGHLPAVGGEGRGRGGLGLCDSPCPPPTGLPPALG